MKDKILTLIIGILIGAIIATSGFLIYTKTHKSDTNMGPNQGQMMEKPENFGGENGQKPDGEPPEKPSNDQRNTQGQILYAGHHRQNKA